MTDRRVEPRVRQRLIRRSSVTLCLAGLAVGLSLILAVIGTNNVAANSDTEDNPTAEDYLAEINASATIVPNGELEVVGRILRCGNRPTVLDPELDDYGAAYPGFLILNPRLMSRLPSAVQLWIHAHECAHQFRGPDEATADCFAVQRGRRRGWLSPSGVEEICAFIGSAKGDATHYSGPERCQKMRQCYKDRKIH
ncbi:MAG: hypothetical protein ACR2OX_01085 [Methyloligellaceae bacterium]